MENGCKFHHIGEEEKRLFTSIHQFKNLGFSELFPNMTKGEFSIIMIVLEREHNGGGKVYVSDIADKTHMRMASVSRSLKELQEKGYIRRITDEKNRRNTYVEVTDEGRYEAGVSMGKVGRVFDGIYSSFGKEKCLKMAELLDELYVVADEEIKSEKMKG